MTYVTILAIDWGFDGPLILLAILIIALTIFDFLNRRKPTPPNVPASVERQVRRLRLIALCVALPFIFIAVLELAYGWPVRAINPANMAILMVALSAFVLACKATIEFVRHKTGVGPEQSRAGKRGI